MIETERTIVVGVDYSDQSVFAVDEALHAAETVRGTRLVAVLVLPANTTSGAVDAEELTNELVERAGENLTQLLGARARALGLEPGSVDSRVRFGAPAEQLLALSRELGAQLIAVGTHGRQGLSHLLVGSVAEEVMRKASCSVLIARSPRLSATTAPSSRSGAQGQAIPAGAERAGVNPPGELPLGAAELEARGSDDDADDDAEPTPLAGPHIDAGRVVLHVLDASGQVFACAFDDDASVSVEPLEGSWVPAASSAARARVARMALHVAARDRALFAELFEEIARRRAQAHPS
jgi:universal stress protein A